MPSTPKFWQKRGLKALLLWPVSQLYGVGARLHRVVSKPYRPVVPVISIGNITAGGTGKTPLVAAIAHHFSERGEVVAILSRGYGAKLKHPIRVNEHHTPQNVGDEPVELYQAAVAAQIWVGPHRDESARLAEAAGASLIILDDGFQHHRLIKDMNLLVLNAAYGLGNGFMMPAGPLREPLSMLKYAHTAVLMCQKKDDTLPPQIDLPAHHVMMAPEDTKTTGDKPVVAFCGLGLPDKFFNRLKESDVNVVETIPYPDHHTYKQADIDFLLHLKDQHNATLVTTPKDAVKLPPMLRKSVKVLYPKLDKRTLKSLFSYLDEHVEKHRTRLQPPEQTILEQAHHA